MSGFIVTRTEDVFGTVDGFYPFMSSPFMTTVFRNRGYVAGGCAREMLSRGVLDSTYFQHSERGSSTRWHAPGDIDVFFRNRDDFESARYDLDCIVKHLDASVSRPSLAGFAHDYHVPASAVTRVQYEDPLCRTVKVQLISSWFGEPVDVIDGFDITAAKVGFDFEHAYVSEQWRSTHDRRVLDMCHDGYACPLTGYRIAKYVRKGYTRLTNSTTNLLCRWIEHFCDNSPTYGITGPVIITGPVMPGMGGVLFDVMKWCKVEPQYLAELGGFLNVRTKIGIIPGDHYDAVEYRLDDVAFELLVRSNADDATVQHARDVFEHRRVNTALKNRGHQLTVDIEELGEQITCTPEV
jgi:hypothetical protein